MSLVRSSRRSVPPSLGERDHLGRDVLRHEGLAGYHDRGRESVERHRDSSVDVGAGVGQNDAPLWVAGDGLGVEVRMGASAASTNRKRANGTPSGPIAQTAAAVMSSPAAGLSRMPRSFWVNNTPGDAATVVRPDTCRSCHVTVPVRVGVRATQTLATADADDGRARRPPRPPAQPTSRPHAMTLSSPPPGLPPAVHGRYPQPPPEGHSTEEGRRWVRGPVRRRGRAGGCAARRRPRPRRRPPPTPRSAPGRGWGRGDQVTAGPTRDSHR